MFQLPTAEAVAPTEAVRLESPMLVTSVQPRSPPPNDGVPASNAPESQGQHEEHSGRQPPNEERQTGNMNVTKDGLPNTESPGTLSSK